MIDIPQIIRARSTILGIKGLVTEANSIRQEEEEALPFCHRYLIQSQAVDLIGWEGAIVGAVVGSIADLLGEIILELISPEKS
jgi:hypothetical protein